MDIRNVIYYTTDYVALKKEWNQENEKISHRQGEKYLQKTYLIKDPYVGSLILTNLLAC